MVIGGDGGDLGVGHRDLWVVGRQFEVLLVFLRAVVAAREGEDQRIAALQFAERAYRARVVRESVVREDAARSDVRTHKTHAHTQRRPVAPVKPLADTLADRGREGLLTIIKWFTVA